MFAWMERPMMDFGFGFDNTAFSDRVLCIELVSADNLPLSLYTSKDDAKTVNVSSLLLGASSHFFYKLFTNGMKESNQREVTMTVCESDEEALIDVIKFLYTNTMSGTFPDLLNRLIVADKFEVICCVRYCCELMKEFPMSVESALSYLQLPESVSQGEAIEPLIVAAKEYLAAQFSDFNKCKEKVMELPLCAVEAVLSCDGLQVDSEDYVFDFILEYAHTHYPKLKECKQIINNRLMPCVCLPSMSPSKLRKVLSCPDIYHQQGSKLVLEALFLKAELDEATSVRRIYKQRPIKVVQLDEYPEPRCVVYFNLRKDECWVLDRSVYIDSPSFNLSGKSFYLQWHISPKSNYKCFAMYLCMRDESERCSVEYEFAVMEKSSKKFTKETSGTGVYSNETSYKLMFIESLYDVMEKMEKMESKYFIDGILHIRVDITIKSS